MLWYKKQIFIFRQSHFIITYACLCLSMSCILNIFQVTLSLQTQWKQTNSHCCIRCVYTLLSIPIMNSLRKLSKLCIRYPKNYRSNSNLDPIIPASDITVENAFNWLSSQDNNLSLIVYYSKGNNAKLLHRYIEWYRYKQTGCFHLLMTFCA